MRIRTYCFPGVLRGHPEPRLATIPADRPRRSLSSPGTFCALQSSGAGRLASATRPSGPRRAAWKPLRGDGSRRGRRPKNDAAPGRLRTRRAWPEGPTCRWRGLTPRWPRSLRLGSASGLKLPADQVYCKPAAGNTPHFLRKKRGAAADTSSLARAGSPAHRTRRKTIVRERLSLVAQ